MTEDSLLLDKIRQEWINTTFFEGDSLDIPALEYALKQLDPWHKWLITIFDSPYACMKSLKRLSINDFQVGFTYEVNAKIIEAAPSGLRQFAEREPFEETILNLIRHIPGVRSKRRRFSPAGLFHQHEFTAFFDYLLRTERMPCSLLHDLMSFLRAGVFLSVFAYHSGAHHAYIIRRPKAVRIDSQKRLHCDNGAAVVWRDRHRQYFLHGVHVNRKFVLIPSHELKLEDLLRVKNVEVRRVVLQKVGVGNLIDKFLKHSGAKIIDRWNGYELLYVNVTQAGLNEDVVCLKMKNPSTEAIHIEAVPPYISTCKAALSWRVGGIEWNPEQLT